MADLIVTAALTLATGLLAGFGFGVAWERRRTDGVPVAGETVDETRNEGAK